MTASIEIGWAKLAEMLGVSRPALLSWRKIEGAPETADPVAWEKFVAERDLGKNYASKGLRDQKLRVEIRKIELQNAALERRMIPREEVNRLLFTIASKQRTRLYGFAESELPPKLDGMDAAAMRPVLREAVDAICDDMAAMVEEFETKEAEA